MSLREFSCQWVGRLPLRQGLAWLGAAAIVTGAAAWMARPDPLPAGVRDAHAKPAAADPLAVEFTRCQALGEAGSRDAACLKAWAESRRRFLSLGAGQASVDLARAPAAAPARAAQPHVAPSGDE